MILSNKYCNNDRLIYMNIMIVKLRFDKMGHIKSTHTHTHAGILKGRNNSLDQKF